MQQQSITSLENVISVLRELNDIGVWHAIDGSECWDDDTIVQAIKYRRATGRNPVSERHLIMLAESELLFIATKDDRKVAEDVLDGGFFNVSDQVRHSIRQQLLEADRRESYAFRREQANIHIANPVVRNRIFKRDGHFCLRCGRKDRLSVDHIIAVANGGGNEDENLQTLCIYCNASKGARMLCEHGGAS